MDRRRFLRTIAIGSLAGVSGCLGAGTGAGVPLSVTDITTKYHGFGPVTYYLTSSLIENPDESALVADLGYDGSATTVTTYDHQARVEGVNAITRAQVINDEPFDFPNWPTLVQYRGSLFSTSVGIGEGWAQPDHGPEYDPDWRDPVHIDARVEGDDLTISLRNALDIELPVHHFGRPYFSVLTAINSTPSILQHAKYEANEYIQTDPVVRVVPEDGYYPETDSQEVLQPGGRLEETYRLPTDIAEPATVWFSIPIGNDSIELLESDRARPPVVQAAITLDPDAATQTE